MHLKSYQKHINGFTLIELLVSLAIASIIITITITAYVAFLKQTDFSTNTSKLNTELNLAMDIMSKNIARAGYWANASSDLGVHINNNPFMNSSNGTDIQTPTANCILFTYDKSGDGSLPSISINYDDERYGYRLSNNAIQARTQGQPFDCGASNSSWENLTDSNVITVTNLTFTLSNPVTLSRDGRTIFIRYVDIALTASLKNDSTFTKTINAHVRIENDKITP